MGDDGPLHRSRGTYTRHEARDARDTSWYKKVFGEDYLRAYRSHFSPERAALEVQEMVAILALPRGSSVLDLCCGQGRHAIALAERGYRVTGLDLSPVLLHRAASDAAARGMHVRWVRSDMREIPFEDEFDAVINVFTSFGYLETDDEDRKVLREIHKALKPAGRFLLEVANRNDLMRRYATASVEIDPLEDSTVVVWKSRFDPLTNRYEVRGVLRFPDGWTGNSYHSHRSYALPELAEMLEGAGLPVQAYSGGLDGSELSPKSRRLVIVSQKGGHTR